VTALSCFTATHSLFYLFTFLYRQFTYKIVGNALEKFK
jgi:hypothetical protein